MDSYVAFKRIRNQLRKLDRNSLITTILAKLHVIEGLDVDKWGIYLPWRLLLLLKWAFEYSGENYPLIKCDEYFLKKLIILLQDFEVAEKNPFLEQGNITGINKFLRMISFQQFPLQKEMFYLDIARQIELFCNSLDGGPIKQKLSDHLGGIKLTEFIELFWCIWAWVEMSPKNVVFTIDQVYGNTSFSKSAIEKFLGILSLEPSEVKKFLQDRKYKIQNPYYQLFESSPFIMYPLLKLGNRYLIYSRQILIDSLMNYFYDTMKHIGGSDLCEIFSLVFEKYITKGFESIPIDLIPEKELMHIFPEKKVTDFIIPFSELTVLVELKAIELKPLARVNPSNSILNNELRDSICKGVIQGYSLANDIIKEDGSLHLCNRKEFFLLIITYKNLYLGPGEVAWEEFIKDSVSDYLQENEIDQIVISPERIIFLSVDEFDLLISVLNNGTVTLPKVLLALLNDNKSSETRKFSFSQHLQRWIRAETKHPFLPKIFTNFTEDLRGKFIN